MADHDRRQPGGGGARKRRHDDDGSAAGNSVGNDGQNRRNTRRRPNDNNSNQQHNSSNNYGHNSSPPHIRMRRQLRAIAESPLRRWHEEAQGIGALVVEHGLEDERLRTDYLELTLQLALEQPLKTPFLAAVSLVVNARRPEIMTELLGRATAAIERSLGRGEWRDVKLLLKLLACLQSCLEGAGLFPLLEELFARAVDLQTASSEDTIGTEIVRIILLTVPYIIAASPGRFERHAAELMDKTEIIATEPHALQALVDPYCPRPGRQSPAAAESQLRLLQMQLQAEAAAGWPLACLPRPWKLPLSDVELQEQLDAAQQHALPAVTIPATAPAGPRPLFPEVYFSVFAGQEVTSVPPPSSVAASLVRDGLVDTINILDFNRNVSARFLIELDCYFADDTFVHRATPFDRLREIEPGRPCWKPEDVAVDAVFSQILQLPVPERKLVYYHSILTEACKLAPGAIAPSLGRAIRFLYRSSPALDLELSHRFVGWFGHHLSNFGFMWKWTEWAEDVALPDLHPRKALIMAALDREVRLSFAQRIRTTLPAPYQPLLGPERDKDVPEFKFDDESVPLAAEGRELAALLRRKAPDEELGEVLDRIRAEAAVQNADLDPIIAATDVLMTAVCAVGSKSLSHVLACIDRIRTRLLSTATASDAARAQVITSVAEYWRIHPGVALAIVEKLLDFSIVTPDAVVHWALTGPGVDGGDALATGHVFEMVFNTVTKVTGRVRQLAVKCSGTAGRDKRDAEAAAMRALLRTVEAALIRWAGNDEDQAADAIVIDRDDGAEDAADQDEEDGDVETAAGADKMRRRWAARWLRVFRRRATIEDAFLLEAAREKGASEEEDGADAGMEVEESGAATAAGESGAAMAVEESGV